MFTSKHAVFIGPGALPKELRDVLFRRQGQPQPELHVAAPRLLAVFESAAEAERVAAQVQRLRIATLLSGPEHTPVEAGWWQVDALSEVAGGWRLELRGQEPRVLRPESVRRVAIVDWRPGDGNVDRAVLLHSADFDRPLQLRARTLGFRELGLFLDGCATVMPEAVPVRSRRLGPDGFADFEGDLLTVALAMVDTLDDHHARLSKPLGVSSPRPSPVNDAPPTTTVAWLTWLAAAVAALGSLALTAVAVMVPSVMGVAAGLVMLGWASQRFVWSRWFAHVSGATIPPLPLSEVAPGQPPTLSGLALDALQIMLLAAASDGRAPVAPLARAGLALALGSVAISLVAVKHRPHE